MIISGDLSMVFFIPLRTSSYILSASIKTKLITTSEGKTSSTASTVTYSSIFGSTALTQLVQLVQIRDPPVFLIFMTSIAFEQDDPPPAWQTVAMSPNPLKCTFFKARLCVTLKGQNMNSLPFSPNALPSTTDSIPTCEPTLSIVQPGSTNLAIFLRLLGYQRPELIINLDTQPSFESTKRLTPSQMVGTSTSLSLSQNL